MSACLTDQQRRELHHMARNKILLIEDEAGIRFGIQDFLRTHGFEVVWADTCQTALEVFRNALPDAVLLDYRLPDGNALELLPRLKEIDSGPPVIILTGHGSIDLAVRAIKEGAEQFLTKPVELPSLLVIMQRLLENQRIRQKQLVGKSKQARHGVNPFLGNSPAIKQLEEQARRVIAADSPVLIQGETGTGKSVLAQWLHHNSPRADEAFVDMNCAGLSRDLLDTELFGHEKGAFTGASASKTGLLEVAHRGTVFLDEIGDMPLTLQAKLLRVLQDREFQRVGGSKTVSVNIRIIAATNRDLRQAVKAGQFREDLYFRLNVVTLTLPPLRERQGDVPALAQFFLERHTRDAKRPGMVLSAAAVEALIRYPWPGNIRELDNVIARAVVLSPKDTIEPDMLALLSDDADVRKNEDEALQSYLDLPYHESMEEHSRYIITRAMERAEGNQTKAAESLKLQRTYLARLLKHQKV